MKIFYLIFSFALLSIVYAKKDGEFREIDVNNKNLHDTLMHVERQMDNRINSNIVHRIGTIHKAESQLVAGIKYRVTFDFGETDCLKSDHQENVESCQFNGKKMMCKALALHRAWLEDEHERYQLIDFHCN